MKEITAQEKFEQGKEYFCLQVREIVVCVVCAKVCLLQIVFSWYVGIGCHSFGTVFKVMRTAIYTYIVGEVNTQPYVR